MGIMKLNWINSDSVEILNLNGETIAVIEITCNGEDWSDLHEFLTSIEEFMSYKKFETRKEVTEFLKKFQLEKGTFMGNRINHLIDELYNL